MSTKRIMIILLFVVGILAIALIAINPFQDIGLEEAQPEDTSQWHSIAAS